MKTTMALAALFAATSLFAIAPATADDGKAQTPTTVTVGSATDDEIPSNAPKDDYRFVAWCFGAMAESITVYHSVIPELKAIDARIGSPVKEAVPYADDVAEEQQALKRFAAAMEAAERASPRPIAPEGAAAMELGRSIWSQAKTQPPRQLAHAWLQWGSPDKCEVVAKNLKTRATLLGQALAVGAPSVDAPPAPLPAPVAPVDPASTPAAAPPPADPASAAPTPQP